MLKYNKFIDSLNEGIRIPKDEEYWKKKGKEGKNVALYFHDDCDGIYSAIVMKNWLEERGFNIIKYGIVNYQEGWTTTNLDPKLINIALDYAEDVPNIDVYMDHHGNFVEGDYKGKQSIKTATGSAYEGICKQLGLATDSLVLDVIDMIDSAKYDEFKIDMKEILDFDPKKFTSRLEFAAAFNQLLKRSDHKTFIEVVANSTDKSPSIYNVYRLFKILYPANNMDNIQLKKYARLAGFLNDNGRPDLKGYIKHLRENDPKYLKGFEKDFVEDARWRLDQMQSRTRGKSNKEYILDQNDFKSKFSYGTGVKIPGYQILGQMCFIPSGTWANALRGRAIYEQDLLDDLAIPSINYKVLPNSPLYHELKNKIDKKLELVGDISGKGKNQKLLVKNDVTDNENIEGIKGKLIMDGGDMIFVAKQPIFWLMLQYGNTLQIASLHGMKGYVKEYLPKNKQGETIDHLGDYTVGLLNNFIDYFGYVKKVEFSDGKVIDTKAGGHLGIGSVSNIWGSVKSPEGIVSIEDSKGEYRPLTEKQKSIMKTYEGTRFLDLFRNKIISDLSGINWPDLGMKWGDPDEKPIKASEMDKKTMLAKDVRKAQDVRKSDNK